MNVMYFLVPLAIMLAAAGVAGFMWAVKSGQFSDTFTPSLRMLEDETEHQIPQQEEKREG
jgi:cbb3-type cytochrome oxidase maturation protein